ncbi:hypothetical protein M0804_015269 [Polistes exclamans]|nr:hypothetical protein M0804_015269 [Polistes exclamans]
MVKVMLMSSVVPVKVSTGKITLHSGTVYQMGDEHCLDLELGYTFWNPVEPVLYPGSEPEVELNPCNENPRNVVLRADFRSSLIPIALALSFEDRY